MPFEEEDDEITPVVRIPRPPSPDDYEITPLQPPPAQLQPLSPPTPPRANRDQAPTRYRPPPTVPTTILTAKRDKYKLACVRATRNDNAVPDPACLRDILRAVTLNFPTDRINTISTITSTATTATTATTTTATIASAVSIAASPDDTVFQNLRKRMMLNEAVVAVKSQAVFHHLFRAAPPAAVRHWAANAHGRIFDMSTFCDSSPVGVAHAPFVRAYGSYLQQWLSMKATIDFPRDDYHLAQPAAAHIDPAATAAAAPLIAAATGVYRDAPVEILLEALPVLCDSIAALCNVPIGSSVRHTPAVRFASAMLVSDLATLWATLCTATERLLELFFSLDLRHANAALTAYKRFVETVAGCEIFFSVVFNHYPKWHLPKLGTVELDLAPSMQAHIDGTLRQAGGLHGTQLQPSQCIVPLMKARSEGVDSPYTVSAFMPRRESAPAVPRQADRNAAMHIRPIRGAPLRGRRHPAAPENVGRAMYKLKDSMRTTVATAMKDQWHVVVMKATRRDTSSPKLKHIRFLVEGTRAGGTIANRKSACGSIFFHLVKRMSSREWMVAIKGQTVFHHIFRDRSERFTAEVATNARNKFRRNLFPRYNHNFKKKSRRDEGHDEKEEHEDDKDEEDDIDDVKRGKGHGRRGGGRGGGRGAAGSVHGTFIEAYGAYLERMLAMRAGGRTAADVAGLEGSTDSSRHGLGGSMGGLLARVHVALDTVASVGRVPIETAVTGRHGAAGRAAAALVVEDHALAWAGAAAAMAQVLDVYFELELAEARAALTTYTRFVSMAHGATGVFGAACTLGDAIAFGDRDGDSNEARWRVPAELEAIPLGLYSAMHEYCAERAAIVQ